MPLCQTCEDKETKSRQDNDTSRGLLPNCPGYRKWETNQENIRRESPVERTWVEFPITLKPDLLPDYPGCKKKQSELRKHNNCRDREKPKLVCQ